MLDCQGMLFSTILYCTVYSTLLCSTLLFYFSLIYSMLLCYAILYCAILYYAILYYTNNTPGSRGSGVKQASCYRKFTGTIPMVYTRNCPGPQIAPGVHLAPCSTAMPSVDECMCELLYVASNKSVCTRDYTILYHSILYWMVQYCTITNYTKPNYTILHSIILYYTALHLIVQYCTITSYAKPGTSMLHYTALSCIKL